MRGLLCVNRGAADSLVIRGGGGVCIALDEMCSLIGFGRKFQTFSIFLTIYIYRFWSHVCVYR